MSGSKDLQRGTTCAAVAGKNRSPWGSRCCPCWVSVRVRYKERPAEPGRNFQEGREVLQYIQNHKFCPTVIHRPILIRELHVSLLSVCTFGFLRRAAAHSSSAVKAISFDGTQMQHLCILKNSINLIPDPVQGHDFALCEPERELEVNIKKAQKASVKVFRAFTCVKLFIK